MFRVMRERMGAIKASALVAVPRKVTVGMLLLVGMVSLATPASASDQSARNWLDRMSRAVKELNYQGVLIYGDSRHWETLSITHGVMDGVEYERLVHLTGQPREVIRKGHDVTCIHPGEHVMRVSLQQNPLTDNLGDGFAGPDSGVDAYYQLSLASGDRVAGRATQQVVVSPIDQYRYGYRLWLDRQTGLALRSDLVDHSGQVLERFQFAEISIDVPFNASDFEPQSQGHRVAAHMASHETSAVLNRQGWQLGWVPRGFMATASQVQRDDRERGGLATLMYSDGLAALTVFVDRAKEASATPASHRWGATAAVVSYLKTSKGYYRITVVAEVPLHTARKIAQSVMPQ